MGKQRVRSRRKHCKRVNESYVYLTTKDVIYASCGMWAGLQASLILGVFLQLQVTFHYLLLRQAEAEEDLLLWKQRAPSTLTVFWPILKSYDDGQTIEYVDLPAGGGAGGSAILPSGTILQKFQKMLEL